MSGRARHIQEIFNAIDADSSGALEYVNLAADSASDVLPCSLDEFIVAIRTIDTSLDDGIISSTFQVWISVLLTPTIQCAGCLRIKTGDAAGAISNVG